MPAAESPPALQRLSRWWAALAVVTLLYSLAGWRYVAAAARIAQADDPIEASPAEFQGALRIFLRSQAADDPATVRELRPHLAGAFRTIGLGVAAAFIVHAAVTAWIASLLARRRRRVLCLVFALLNLLFTPWGTLLGIWTLVVLSRPEVRAAFARPTDQSAAHDGTPR